MDKHRVIGSVRPARAALKEALGKAVGDTKLVIDGKSEKLEAKIQNAMGGAKDLLDLLRRG